MFMPLELFHELLFLFQEGLDLLVHCNRRFLRVSLPSACIWSFFIPWISRFRAFSSRLLNPILEILECLEGGEIDLCCLRDGVLLRATGLCRALPGGAYVWVTALCGSLATHRLAPPGSKSWVVYGIVLPTLMYKSVRIELIEWPCNIINNDQWWPPEILCALYVYVFFDINCACFHDPVSNLGMPFHLMVSNFMFSIDPTFAHVYLWALHGT